MKLLRLKALGIVVLLFLGVYVPTFFVIGLVKPRPQTAIPLAIGLSLGMALTMIYFLSSRARNFSQFGFRGSSLRYTWAAVALGVPVGLALTFVASRFHSTNPFGDVSLRPWMIVFYFIVGTPIQEEVIFRGLLQTILERRLGTHFVLLGTSLSFAALMIAVLFGLIHLAIGVPTAIVAFVLGLLAGELRRRSLSLVPAIVLHAIFNAFSAIW
ncbi:MAG TPA: type II CAAX endopeptidase family protein [Chthoniobacterales bacterium]|nr:type II CAAX endopeptidase family protein [Chthoniobacterales bacterium]